MYPGTARAKPPRECDASVTLDRERDASVTVGALLSRIRGGELGQRSRRNAAGHDQHDAHDEVDGPAARIMALAGPAEVLASDVIPPLVLGSGITFDDRGSYELKGVRDPWPVLAVRD